MCWIDASKKTDWQNRNFNGERKKNLRRLLYISLQRCRRIMKIKWITAKAHGQIRENQTDYNFYNFNYKFRSLLFIMSHRNALKKITYTVVFHFFATISRTINYVCSLVSVWKTLCGNLVDEKKYRNILHLPKVKGSEIQILFKSMHLGARTWKRNKFRDKSLRLPR